ncbi:AFG1/ZapE family ATPase [Streptomyces sp. NPDC093089]|uniref:AFG1/ZapE family ATPase n=1 Tax=Streptomyces sp. NPDC093089 TaxID=3366024 RepID=UPI0037F935A0
MDGWTLRRTSTNRPCVATSTRRRRSVDSPSRRPGRPPSSDWPAWRANSPGRAGRFPSRPATCTSGDRPVGRGKSRLVDTFYEGLPDRRKRRLHFHDSFRRLHDGVTEPGPP